jgi:hypothetical protein
MALQENLSQHDAYAAMIAITDDQGIRDDLLARAGTLPGTWAWLVLPDGSGLGLLARPGTPDWSWSVNYVPV